MITLDQLITLLSKKYKITSEVTKRSYLLPDGRILAIPSFESHQSVKDYLHECGISSKEAELEDYGCIRVNLDSEGFIELSSIKPTYIQYDALTETLDKFLNANSYFRRGAVFNGVEQFIIIEPANFEERTKHQGYAKELFHYFDFRHNGYTTDDYIKIIKNYYATKVFRESLDNEKDIEK